MGVFGRCVNGKRGCGYEHILIRKRWKMHLNLERSYPQLALKGKATTALRLPDTILSRADLVTKSWPHSPLDFYISLDVALGELKQELLAAVASVRGEKTGEGEGVLIALLRDWLRVVKKMEFYHIESNNKDLFYSQNGLLHLYESGSLQAVYFLSEIQKYRPKNAEECALTLLELRKDQMEIIYRDVCLKISRHLLTQLKNEMYFPSRDLVTRLLSFYGFTYDFSKPFLHNYRCALADKRVAAGESREASIVLFTLKMICGFQSLPRVCHYIAYLKNVLLDRSNGILTAEYETWLLLYETCLKLFSRYQALREEEAIQIDQILSSSYADADFQLFLVRNALEGNVSLSSINFYVKNCRREEREELQPHILAKIDLLMQQSFWKDIQDIYEYVENELEGQIKEEYLNRIKHRVAALPHEEVSSQKLYEVEYGLTFILQNILKHVHEFAQILPQGTLSQISDVLQHNPSLEKTTILFRYFSQFITLIYSETSYESMDLPAVAGLLRVTGLFQQKGLICHKSVYKFIYYQLSSEEAGQELWEEFFLQLPELYFCGGYEENSDLELIHSHEDYRESLATRILQAFQLLICAQITERRDTARCLQGFTSAIQASFFMVRSFKDGLLFQSIQNICLVFSSHLSMQTLEFGLNYCTPFAALAPWHSQETQLTLLSLICEEMPIETLKFIFKEVTEDSNFDTHTLETIPAEWWSAYWNEDRRDCALAFGGQLSIEKLQALQRLRRLEFILSLSCCVFDKLNENSQKNIKEIKVIFEHAANKIIQVASAMKRLFLQALNLSLLRRVDGLSGEEVRGLEIVQQDNGSFLVTNYIHQNNFLSVAKEFNMIGKVNESEKVLQVEEALLPSLKMPKCTPKDKSNELLYKQVEIALSIEASYLKKITEGDPECFLYEVQFNKEWARQILSNVTSLTALVKKPTTGIPEGTAALSQKLNGHIKCLLSKVLLPETVEMLLVGQCKSGMGRQLVSLMRGCMEGVFSMDCDYQQHFIVVIEKVEQVLKDGKGRQVQSAQLLALLELFFELVFNKIRIRSYHIYRIIKYYQRVTGEGIEQFNTVIAHHIRLLFEQFITNYKNIAQMQQLCSSRRALSPLYVRLAKQEHSLTYVEAACTLSMFINLFCRLNYPSLTLGVEKIFGEEEAKAIYIDYLTALTRKIVTEYTEISARDLQILKIDVYGNLNIITQGKLSERLLNKLISLAKHLLRVKADLKGVNKLPIKILADKIAAEQLEVNLQDFEDECKAISLGAISLHRRLAPFITSNLHLTNIYYVTGRNFEKYIELNQQILGKRQDVAFEVGRVARGGLSALNIQMGEEVVTVLEGLMRKLEKYFQLCLKQTEYAQKLYSLFKILCICCLNNPEILPILLQQRLTIHKTQITFFQFVFTTLKLCLPLFCEFYTTVIKTNSGFLKVSDEEVISRSLEYELTIRKRLLELLKSQIGKKESEYAHLIKAINYVQQYSEGNRFRFYKFVKNTNEAYESVLKEYEKEFNMQLIKICDQYIHKEHSAFTSADIYELLQASMDRAYVQASALDLRKLLNEEQIKKAYHCEKHAHSEHNKENLQLERRSREADTARSKQQQYTACRPLLAQIMQASIPSAVGRIIKGKKAKENKPIRPNHLQEDLISVNDSKGLVTDWSSKGQSQVNRIMVQKFMLFNQEIESRQFLKDAIIFPSRNGLEIIPGDSIQLLKANDGINQQEEDGCIESMDDIKEDDMSNFSARIIEQQQAVRLEEPFNEPRGSDSIIYSQIQIDNREDGSMKLFGDIEEQPQQEEQQQEVSKDDIVALIQDYTLNPQAIKQISLRIKYLPTGDLQKLQGQHSGEVGYVIEAELRNRGIMAPPQTNSYEYFFVDESKIYERLRHKREDKEKDIVIPRFSKQFLGEWLHMVLKAAAEERVGLSKRVGSFCRRMLLELSNIDLLINQSLSLLILDSNQFQLAFPELIFTKKCTADYYKQALVDHLFGVMIEARIALPVIFYGCWDATSCTVAPRGEKAESVMEVLLSVLLRGSEKQSIFLKNLLEYFQALNKVTKYQYPYLEVQDSVVLSKKLIEELSQKMHLSNQTFSDNSKYFSIFRAILYLQVKSYQQFLRVELGRAAEAIKKSYQREESVMQLFRKNYSGEEGLQLERKAEIYWQLRKSKGADEYSAQLVFSRRMLTDLASVVLQCVKENCFALYYKGDELSMKEQLVYLKRRLHEVRHYSEKYELEQEFREKQKRYSFWRRNLLNLIIVQEIVPAVEEISTEFLEQLRQTTQLLSFLYGDFNQIIKSTPIIFRQCGEYYKIMLAYQLLKREEEQTYHSMSTLKTIPSIQSTRQMDGMRRRSSLIRNSIFQIACVDTAAIVKKSALMLSLEALALEPKDPLFALHARYAEMETKLKYLRQENKLGEKVIQVSRGSLWCDTARHLDDTFGDYDIKIKIAGELGIDYGGVTREWLSLIVKEVLDPRLGLFELNVNGLAFQPSRFSYLVPNHLETFHKFGILVGKAMKENWLLELNLTKSFLKHMLGALLYVEDLQDLQPDTAKGLLWILKNYVDEDLGLTFTYEQEILQNKRTLELVPGGSQVFVNQANKKEYVKKLAYTKMTEGIREQSLAFISGVEKVVPIQMLKLFNYREMGKYFAGTSTICVTEMRQFAKYEGYSEEDETIGWFWEVMETLNQQDKAEFLFFLTGSYRVPYSGFKQNPITINKMPACKDYLPVAHTCFSIIDLPEYSSKEKLQRMLLRAVKEGKGFTVS